MDLLSAHPFIIVDCQTTGALPHLGHIIEMAWQSGPEASTRAEPTHSLIQLPDDAVLPVPVRRITGIDEQQLREAPEAELVWAHFERDILRYVGREPREVLFVAHYARFEAAFFADMQRRFGDTTLSFRFICTYEIARRLYPGLPKHTLRALSGYFGRPLGELRRSGEHVAATALIFEKLLADLAEKNIRTLDALSLFLTKKPQKTPRGAVFPMPSEVRRGFPACPGVYRFLDANGAVLYVGKARNLKTRSRSYFQKKENLGGHIREMISQAFDASYTTTRTALEAALLEVEEIKRLRPPYNRALKTPNTAVFYFSSDFRRVEVSPSSDYPRGPYATGDAAADLRWVGDMVSGRTGASPPGKGLREINEEALQAGFQTLCDGIQLNTRAVRSMPQLLSLGAILHLLRQGFEDDPPIPPVEQNGSSPLSDELRQSARIVASIAIRAAREQRLAQFVTFLSDCTIRFSLPAPAGKNVSRELTLRGGRVIDARDGGAEIPVEPAERSRFRLPGRNFDRDRFDFLRVLIGEIRRLTREGRTVSIHFSPGSFLTGDRLNAVLEVL